VQFAGRMYGLPKALAAERSKELLELFELDGAPRKLIAEYSKGMRKRTAMAASLIHRPQLFLMDEPFEGVDAIAAGTLKSMLQGMISRGATIFLTSHVLEIVERLCTHVAIINRGQLVANGSLDELRAGVQAQVHDQASSEKLTLEEIFLQVVGGAKEAGQELSWLG